MNIGLVMCGQHKLWGLHHAKKLYQSNRFKEQFEQAEKACDKVYILSTKHGLLEPERWVWGYNMTLKSLSLEERVSWAQRTFSLLKNVTNPKDVIHFFAEPIYYENLRPLLEKSGYQCVVH